jgi:hypothetical protein
MPQTEFNPNIAKIHRVVIDRQTGSRRTDTSFVLRTHIAHFMQRTHYKNGKVTVPYTYIAALNATLIFCLIYILSYYDMFRPHMAIIRYK